MNTGTENLLNRSYRHQALLYKSTESLIKVTSKKQKNTPQIDSPLTPPTSVIKFYNTTTNQNKIVTGETIGCIQQSGQDKDQSFSIDKNQQAFGKS